MTKKNLFAIFGFLLMTFGIFGMLCIPSFGIQNKGAHASDPFVVPDAEVHAYNINGTGEDTAFTNSTGQYLMNESLTDVGTYTVEASANGYISANANTTITSLSDKNTVDMTLNRSGIIEGRVLGKNGNPVIGAIAQLYTNSSYSYIDQAQTDSNGKYYFATDIQTGVYAVEISFSFPTYYGLPYPDAPYLATGYVEGVVQNISAIQGAITVAPDIILNQSGVITGIVRDDLGNPIPNATIDSSTSILYYPYFYEISTMTNSSGAYRISYDVVNGTYTLYAYADGYVDTSVQVVVNQTGTVTQDLTMNRTATLTGHVLRASDSKPVPGVDIDLHDDTFTYFGSNSTSLDGSYEINRGLGPGNYTVTTSLDGLTLNTTSITLSAGESKTLDFMIDAYFISGTVYANFTGGPRISYPEIELDFFNSTPASGSTSGDVNGTYVLALAIANGTNGLTYDGNFTASADGYNTTIVPVSIVVGTDKTGEDFVLQKSPPYVPPPSATIEGTIYGTAGPSLPFSYQWWHVRDNGYQFMIGLNSSSHVDYIFSSILTKTIEVSVWGPEGTTGQLTIWIPDAIYKGPFSVTSYPGPNPTVSTTNDNGTWTSITITYGHSSKTIVFESTGTIPEFQGSIALITILFSVAIAVCLKKRHKLRMDQRSIAYDGLNSPH